MMQKTKTVAPYRRDNGHKPQPRTRQTQTLPAKVNSAAPCSSINFSNHSPRDRPTMYAVPPAHTAAATSQELPTVRLNHPAQSPKRPHHKSIHIDWRCRYNSYWLFMSAICAINSLKSSSAPCAFDVARPSGVSPAEPPEASRKIYLCTRAWHRTPSPAVNKTGFALDAHPTSRLSGAHRRYRIHMKSSAAH